MSGGEYDYAFDHVEDFIRQLNLNGDSCGYASVELRARFRALLRCVADAMHAIEWNDSGDGAPDEQAKILACLNFTNNNNNNNNNTQNGWAVLRGDLGSDVYLLKYCNEIDYKEVLLTGSLQGCLDYVKTLSDWVGRPSDD